MYVSLGIGLVPVLIFAWVFELTPEGLKKDGDVDRTQTIAQNTGKKLDRMIMVVLALALGYFAFDKFVLRWNGLADEALAMAGKGLEKFPEDFKWRRDLALYRLLLLGDARGYLAFGERLREEGNWDAAGSDLTWLLYGQGEVTKALEHAATRMRGEMKKLKPLLITCSNS